MKKGDFIKINYTGKLETGEIFDLTSEKDAKKWNIYNPKITYGPVTLIVGAGFIVRGLDNEFLNMNVGEKRKIIVKSDDGFGQRKAELVKVLPRKHFTQQRIEPQQGMVVDFSGTKGRIQSVSAGRIRVDFNNPLAGKTLIYDVEIIEKINDPKEQIKSLCKSFGIKNVEIKLNEEVQIEAAVPPGLKKRISDLIFEYIKYETGIKKVKFIEIFERKSK